AGPPSPGSPVQGWRHDKSGQLRMRYGCRGGWLAERIPMDRPDQGSQVRDGLSAGGRWIRTSGTADDARLLADLYAHNASRQMPQKGSSDQAVACLRRLGAGVVGLAAVCAFRFRPPGTGSKRAGWRRSGAIFAFFAAVCFEPDASRARLRFKAVMRSMTGGGAAISLGLTVSPFILASISRGVSAAVHSVRPLSDRTASDGNGRQQREADRHRRCHGVKVPYNDQSVWAGIA